MKKNGRTTATFDPELFLKQSGIGRTVVDLRKNAVVFSQGDDADAVFYIQKGTVKLTVVSPRGKEESFPSSARATSSASNVSREGKKPARSPLPRSSAPRLCASRRRK